MQHTTIFYTKLYRPILGIFLRHTLSYVNHRKYSDPHNDIIMNFKNCYEAQSAITLCYTTCSEAHANIFHEL